MAEHNICRGVAMRGMWKECDMADLDRTTARALVDAGYMPLSDYIARFGDVADHTNEAPLVPDAEPHMDLKLPAKIRNH